MSAKPRVMKCCLMLVLAGVIGVVVRALTAPSEPPPRWDLFILILVALAGALGAFIALFLSRSTRAGVAFGSRYWWPEQRSTWMGFGLFLTVIPVSLVFYATNSYSVDARRIADMDHVIRVVEVRDVLSSDHSENQRTGNSSYASKIEISISFSDGRRTIEGKVYSDEPLRSGDVVWALYAPSSKSSGAVLSANRGDLEEKVGGTVGVPLILLVVGWAAWWLFLALLCGRVGSSFPALKSGRARSLEVLVSGGAAARFGGDGSGGAGRPSPCLLLSVGRDTQLPFLMNRAVDSSALGSTITGEACLYWAPPLRGGHQNSAKRQAVLVVPGDRYVRGWVTETLGSPLPDGSPVPAAKELPGSSRELRAIITLPVWEASIHGVGLVALQIALLALLVMTLNIGTAGAVLLAVIALLALPVAWMVTASRRTRRLTRFLSAVS
jgi:hypothetical protein